MKRVFLSLALLVAPLRAGAQSAPTEPDPAMPARVELTRPACAEALSPDTLLRLLHAELAGDGVERVELAQGEAVERALARVTITTPRCAVDATEFVVVVDDATTRKRAERTLDLTDLPVAMRARGLALAVAELLRVSWLELAEPTPTRPPNLPVVPETIREAVRLRVAVLASRGRTSAPAARWSLSVGVGFEGRVLPMAGTPLAGGRIAVGITPPWNLSGLRLRLRADAGLAAGAGASLLGDVDVLVASGAVAATLNRAASIALEVGPRVEVGVARAVGRAARTPGAVGILANEVADVVVGVGLLLGVQGRLAGPIGASLELEGAWLFGGIDARTQEPTTGADVRAAGVLGPAISCRASITWER